MKGFLSDGFRDIVALVGVLLSIIQMAMSIFVVKSKRASINRASINKDTLPLITGSSTTGFSILRNKGKDEGLGMVICIFVGALLVLFLAAYVVNPPFDLDKLTDFQSIALVFCGVSAFVAGMLSFAVVAAFLEFLSRVSRLSADSNRFYVPSMFIISLLISWIAISNLEFQADWIRFGMYALAISVMFMSALGALVVTVLEAVAFIQDKRTS